jgi:hypothetical protein
MEAWVHAAFPFRPYLHPATHGQVDTYKDILGECIGFSLRSNLPRVLSNSAHFLGALS